ncbi:TlpA family protein disulfide reductase [Fimbriimonas ginsengisoli]|nr:TlpA disulfide reductase family protein [Fimbriimonas ginsengisoli]
MNRIHSLLLASLALSSFALTQTARVDPKVVLSHIRAIQQEAQEKQKRGEAVSEPKTQAQIDKVVADAISGVDPKKVPVEECRDWMTLYQYAKRDADVATVAERGYAQRAFDLMEMDSYIVRRMIDEGKLTEALGRVRNTGFSAGPAMVGQFQLGIARSLAAQAPKHLNEVLAIYDALIDRIHFGAPLSDADHSWGAVAYAAISSEKYALLYDSGKKEQALKALNLLAKEMAKHPESKDAYSQSAASYVAKTIARLTSPDGQSSLLGRPAPALVSDRSLGGPASLGSLKGKVVVLDFMAHWCGPCKRALPELAKLQDRLGPKGLQIVSLTGYYGYFGARTGLKPDAEFAEMGRFVKDFGMAWPVLFDATAKNNSNYAVSAIPQLVVIDRNGIVRKIEVGYEPTEFAKTVRLLEDLTGK